MSTPGISPNLIPLQSQTSDPITSPESQGSARMVATQDMSLGENDASGINSPGMNDTRNTPTPREVSVSTSSKTEESNSIKSNSTILSKIGNLVNRLIESFKHFVGLDHMTYTCKNILQDIVNMPQADRQEAANKIKNEIEKNQDAVINAIAKGYGGSKLFANGLINLIKQEIALISYKTGSEAQKAVDRLDLKIKLYELTGMNINRSCKSPDITFMIDRGLQYSREETEKLLTENKERFIEILNEDKDRYGFFSEELSSWLKENDPLNTSTKQGDSAREMDPSSVSIGVKSNYITLGEIRTLANNFIESFKNFSGQDHILDHITGTCEKALQQIANMPQRDRQVAVNEIKNEIEKAPRYPRKRDFCEPWARK